MQPCSSQGHTRNCELCEVTLGRSTGWCQLQHCRSMGDPQLQQTAND